MFFNKISSLGKIIVLSHLEFAWWVKCISILINGLAEHSTETCSPTLKYLYNYKYQCNAVPVLSMEIKLNLFQCFIIF